VEISLRLFPQKYYDISQSQLHVERLNIFRGVARGGYLEKDLWLSEGVVGEM
jgi:hypothetical protein